MMQGLQRAWGAIHLFIPPGRKIYEHRTVNCHFTEMQDSLSGRNNKQEREEGEDAVRERAQREVMPLISQSLRNSDGLETTLLERTLS